MTPDDYASLWLSECWAPVRQYHAGMEPEPPVDTEGKKRCPHCGEWYSRGWVEKHVQRFHQRERAA